MDAHTKMTRTEKLAELDARERQLRQKLATKLPAPIRKFARMALDNIAVERRRLLTATED